MKFVDIHVNWIPICSMDDEISTVNYGVIRNSAVYFGVDYL